LLPVATWKTRVIDLREIGPGETVGYGATFVSERPMRLALLPVGYADGFRREASSGVGDGWVMIAGQRAPVVGRVSMNLTVVDVTAHEAVRVGDPVVLLGEGVTAEDLAGWCRTIPYEILCGMQGRQVIC
jgi:alanine racemase